MKHMRTAGLCIIAVLALGGLVAAAAQAEGPEWGRCRAQAKSNYTEDNCKTVSEKKGVPDHKGSYEWYPGSGSQCIPQEKGNYTESECKTVSEKKGVPDHKGKYEKTPSLTFTSESGALIPKWDVYVCENSEGESLGRKPRADCAGGKYKNLGLDEVECESEHASGEATGTDEVANVSLRLTGCREFHLYRFNSPGLKPGEIQFNTLKGRLGYIEGKGTAYPKVGLLLEPATPGGKLTEFEYSEILLDHLVLGSGNATEGAFYQPEATGGYDGIISPITPVNETSLTFKQDYTVEKTGEEEVDQVVESSPSHFEGEHNDLLEWYMWNPEDAFSTAWGPLAIESVVTDTTSEDAEIKA